ncbi:MAG TPA: fimbria/pilus outer membrane usher protein [Ramlibacter sp.]|jgi:outer membrane usher protein
MPLDVTVNKTPGGIWPIVSRDGVLHAPVEAFGTWRIEVPADTPTVDYRGLRYYALPAIPGLDSRIDPEKGALELSVAAGSFAGTRLTRELAQQLPRTPIVPALFLNYDINYEQAFGQGASRSMGLLGEAGWSTRWGVWTQTFVGRDLGAATGRALTRLETTMRRDFPDQGYTLVAGDSATRTGLLGRSAYFGGIQFGTNFELAPHVNRQPIPLVAGETSAPSVVQLYVNDVLRQTSNVPAGPFTLDNLPVLSGNGQVTVRVRDILGRETLITQPFFVSADLLAPGLNDWTVEAGRLRRNLGADSSSYGTGFGTGMWRRGLSSTTTVEGRAEISPARNVLGAAVVRSFGADWMVRAGAMVARDRFLGAGHRWVLGVDRPGYDLTFGATLEGSSRSFRSLGETRSQVPMQYQFAAQASYGLRWGLLGAALAVQQPYDLERVTTVSLNYSATLRSNWQVNVYFSRAFAAVGGTTLGAVLSVPLDRQTISSTSVQMQRNGVDVYTSVARTPEGSTGLAWRALVGRQDETRAEAGAYYLGRHGQLNADVSTRAGQSNLRLSTSGALLRADGRHFAIPRFDTSAALVEVPGFGGVAVGASGRLDGQTDAAGFALIPRLSPYQSNRIQLDPSALPISAEIDSIEAEAVPPWRSVARLVFPVRSGRAALVRIELEDGEPAPAGAVLRIEGEEREFYVARRGEAYVTGLQDNTGLSLAWGGASCRMRVTLPAGSNDEIARVGPVRCLGVKR